MIKKLAKIILEKTHLVIHLLFFFNVCASKHSKDPAEFSFALSWRRCYCVNSLGFSKYLNFYFTFRPDLPAWGGHRCHEVRGSARF